MAREQAAVESFTDFRGAPQTEDSAGQTFPTPENAKPRLRASIPPTITVAAYFTMIRSISFICGVKIEKTTNWSSPVFFVAWIFVMGLK